MKGFAMTPRGSSDAAVVFAVLSQLVRTAQDPEVQKAARKAVLAVGTAVTVLGDLGCVWEGAWRRAGAAS